jgi:DNA-binding NarL/FixJ family response regulator
MIKKTKILIADDHQIFRQGLVKQIESDSAYEIIAEAGDGKEALEKIISLKPDIAIIDISMPVINGMEVIQECMKEKTETNIIVLTMYKEEQYFKNAIELGVKGYLLKANSFENLMDCLKAVTLGEHYFSPQLSGFVASRYGELESLKKKTPGLDELTPTERKVLKLIVETKTSKEIAKELSISHRTEEKHRENICNKLGIKGVNKLIKFALEHKSFL